MKLKEFMSGLPVSMFKLRLLEPVKWGGELIAKDFLVKCNQRVILPDFFLQFTR